MISNDLPGQQRAMRDGKITWSKAAIEVRIVKKTERSTSEAPPLTLYGLLGVKSRQERKRQLTSMFDALTHVHFDFNNLPVSIHNYQLQNLIINILIIRKDKNTNKYYITLLFPCEQSEQAL